MNIYPTETYGVKAGLGHSKYPINEDIAEKFGEYLASFGPKIHATLMYYDILRSMTDEERESGCCIRRVQTSSIDVGELLDFAEHFEPFMTFAVGDKNDDETTNVLFMLPHETPKALEFYENNHVSF